MIAIAVVDATASAAAGGDVGVVVDERQVEIVAVICWVYCCCTDRPCCDDATKVGPLIYLVTRAHQYVWSLEVSNRLVFLREVDSLH